MTEMNMAQLGNCNVECKLRLPPGRKWDAFEAACKQINGIVNCGEFCQRDTYFRHARGRWKLREQTDDPGPCLIYYERADVQTQRSSFYSLCPLSPEAVLVLKAQLTAAVGEDIVVAKRRHLFLWRGVRLHLDHVDGLGRFVELEGCVDERDGRSLQEMRTRVTELRALLGLEDDALVEPLGYRELLAAKS